MTGGKWAVATNDGLARFVQVPRARSGPPARAAAALPTRRLDAEPPTAARMWRLGQWRAELDLWAWQSRGLAGEVR